MKLFCKYDKLLKCHKKFVENRTFFLTSIGGTCRVSEEKEIR